jgi:hypothetical protein
MTYENPPFELECLTIYVINCYAPSYFSFKMRPLETDAPKGMFDSMKLLLTLLPEELAVVLPVFERGFYWGHSTNLLIAMVADEDAAIRKDAVDRIMALRHPILAPTPSTSTGRGRGRPAKKAASGVCTYVQPKPVYEAPSYDKMIDWEVEQVIEPPYLTQFSDAQVQEFLVTPLSLPIKGHTQHVERMIRNITEQGTRAATAEKRDGLVRATLNSRKRLPKAETKADFAKF